MTKRLALAATALALLPAATATAADAPLPKGFAAVPARGATAQGRFTGKFYVDRFAARGTDLVARGRLIGKLKDRRYPSTQDVEVGFTTVVALTPPPAGAACSRLTLGIAGKTARLFGLRTALAPQTVAVRPHGPDAAGMKEVLCATTELLAAQPPANPAAPQPPASWLLHQLNGLRAIAG
jgi:hypothetical protein